MFKITWKSVSYYSTVERVITGLSSFATRELAEQQAAKWRSLFPFNSYQVELI